MDYPRALATAKKARNQEKGAKVDNNTYIRVGTTKHGRCVFARLHSTDILAWRPNGDIALNTSGWRTVTTKDRLNTLLPVAWVSSIRGVWYVQVGGKQYPYADGMIIHADGSVSGAGTFDPEADKQLRKEVKEYVKLVVKALPLPRPGPGDCFYCQLRTVDEGVPLGEKTRNLEHLRSHMEEGYVVPSLVYRALEAAKAGPAWYWQAFLDADGNSHHMTLGTAQIAGWVRKYLMKQFGYGQ